MASQTAHRTHTAIGAWLLLGTLAFVGLPWFIQADKSLLEALPGVFGPDDTASGLFQVLRYGRVWLAVVPLALVLCALAWRLPPGRMQGRWLAAGGAIGVNANSCASQIPNAP